MTITEGYEEHYKKIGKTYPSVFALKTMLGNNPEFTLRGKLPPGSKVIDIGFGDGRDLNLFLDLGLIVSGVEPSEKIVQHTLEKFNSIGKYPCLKCGTNTNTGFPNEEFDLVYANAALNYFVDATVTMLDPLSEVHRVCKPGGYFLATLPTPQTHILVGAKKISDNIWMLQDPYYQVRNGQYYHVYADESQLQADLEQVGFTDILIRQFDANWFGTRETLFMLSCRKMT